MLSPFQLASPGARPRYARDVTTTTAYSARAAEYIELLGSISAVHPSDRQIVENWATQIDGEILDAGCGPGHWTGHLNDLGCDVRGVDLVPSFLEHARASHPGIRFDLGSIDGLDAADGSLSGILSWFSTIHHTPDAIAVPFAEFARVLRSGGQLALGFFSGEMLEPFDHAVTRAYRWPASDLIALLDDAGFTHIETHLRDARGQRPVGTIICERRGRMPMADALRPWQG